MWLKITHSTLSNLNDKVIFSNRKYQTLGIYHPGVDLYTWYGELGLRFIDVDKRYAVKVLAGTVDADEWTHVLGTWNINDKVRLYINGISSANIDTPVGVVPHDSREMQLGRTAWGLYAAFTIDEWYFWDKTLTDEQVTEVYQGYKQGNRKCMSF